MPVTSVPDELWERVRPLIPPDRARTGRPRADARACLAGILYVLRTGCAWNRLPARVWPALHRRLVKALADAGDLDVSAVVADSGSVRAVSGGRTPAPARWTGPRRAASGT